MINDAIFNLNDFRKSLISWMIGTAGVMLVAFIAFYFNTQNALQDHERRININTARIEQKASMDEMREFKQAVKDDINAIHADIKEVRDDNKKILEILSNRNR